MDNTHRAVMKKQKQKKHGSGTKTHNKHQLWSAFSLPQIFCKYRNNVDSRNSNRRVFVKSFHF